MWRCWSGGGARFVSCRKRCVCSLSCFPSFVDSLALKITNAILFRPLSAICYCMHTSEKRDGTDYHITLMRRTEVDLCVARLRKENPFMSARDACLLVRVCTAITTALFICLSSFIFPSLTLVLVCLVVLLLCTSFCALCPLLQMTGLILASVQHRTLCDERAWRNQCQTAFTLR